ncbi:TIGR02594 family protein, partial [Helicobacter bilis]|uniref:TIGR02594 family protein n=2 Tax=Helicobacter bilis TaxID=37372 RepID=UPI0025581852
NKECTNTIESTTQRNNFYIHGGESYGDNGGIDLAKEDTRFFKVLESIKKEYKDILESLKDNEGRMVVRLGVGYEEELPWISIAKGELGIKENTSKSEHNPRIIQYHSTTTGKFQDDETPWCSSFVNWVITQAGLKGTNSARAASWKDWGQKLNKAAYGCIGVRIRANGTGHVTFIVGKLDNKKLVGLGGNQANSVKYSEYSTNNFKAFVYPLGYTPNYELPLMDSKFVGKGDSTR